MTARQPRGIPAGGQFAGRAHGEAGLLLTAGATNAEADSVTRLTSQYASMFADPAVARQAAQDMVDRACQNAGDGIPRDWVAAGTEADRRLADHGSQQRSPLGTWSVGSPETGQVLRDAYQGGMPADWADQMAARGQEWKQGV